MDFGSVMNQVRADGEGAGVPSPRDGGVLEGVSPLQGAGATRGTRAVMGWCVEGGCAPRVGGSAAVCHQRGSRGAGGLEEGDAVLAGRRTWAGGEGRFAAVRDL